MRDSQRKTHQWTPGKNFDATGAIGPVVVTPDEIPEGASGLKIQTRVGDEILQSGNTSKMLWSVARTPPRWLRPGETVEVEIEGIGICASPIVSEKDA